jgi:hypothetical protein
MVTVNTFLNTGGSFVAIKQSRTSDTGRAAAVIDFALSDPGWTSD